MILCSGEWYFKQKILIKKIKARLTLSTSILICTISGIFWALFDLTRKLTLIHITPKLLLILFSSIQIIIFSFWCVKESFFLSLYPYSIPGITLVLLGVISALMFLKSIRESDLSLTIPLLSFSPLFSSIFSFIFLNEKLNNIQYAGIFSVIFGTLILYSEKFEIACFLKSISNIKNSLSAKLMIIVSLCWSLTPVLDKICLTHSSINIHGLVQSFSTCLILLVFSKSDLKIFKKLKKKNFLLILFTISIGTIATIFQFYAILYNYVPIMESIKRATGQLSAIIFGKIFFDEKITKQKVFGVLIISLGVNFLV